jgi:ornithine cyclodeaminase
VSPPFVDGERLVDLVSMEQAIDALEEMFAGKLPDTPQRQILRRSDSQLLLMPAWGERFAGVKLVGVQPHNSERGLPLVHGVYVLFDGDTLEPIALFDAGPLTALRTAAVSGLATRHLAAESASRLVVFGSGVQAESHVHAMATVRDLSEVVIVGRTTAGAEKLVARLSEGFLARVGTPGDAASAELVCTCTTSSEPLFAGRLLPRGVHVNAVGAHSPQARELDTDTIRRATVVVETKEAALAEAGDLLIPLGEGLAEADVIAATLSEVVAQEAPDVPGELTVFKSVGVAFEDLAVACFAAERL